MFERHIPASNHLKPSTHKKKDFAYHYIDKVNELYAQLQMPVYGIYKVRDPKTLKAFEKVIAVLEKSTLKELAEFKKILLQKRRRT